MRIQSEMNSVSLNRTSVPANFKGLRLKMLSPAKGALDEKSLQNIGCRLSYMIDISEEEILSLIKGASSKRISFLTNLIKKYNAMYFKYYSVDSNLRESTEVLTNIYKKIEKPTKEHSAIVNNTECSFKELGEVFDLAPDKHSLKFIRHVQNEILDTTRGSLRVIKQMLMSPNRELYIKDPENFSSYLKLNSKSEDAIAKLDEIIASGSYNSKKYDRELYVEEDILSGHIADKHFQSKKDVLEEYYTEEGAKLLNTLVYDIIQSGKYSPQFDINEVLEMYKSVTPKNYRIRKNILEKYVSRSPYMIDNNQETVNVQQINNLFYVIDKNKNLRKFVEKLISEGAEISSIDELIEIIQAVPAKKGQVFIDNLVNIIRRTKRTNRTEVIKNELENPFYMTEEQRQSLRENYMYGYVKRESQISKLGKWINNKINQIIYGFISKGDKTAEIGKQNPVETIVPETLEPVSTVIDLTSHTEGPAKITLTNGIKETAKERKIRLSKEVNEYVKSILGKKTYERQNGMYEESVTKMRLKLLPDIFNSIKENAQFSRRFGKHPTANKSDAITLYQLINGRNRKLVRYMLKQRDSENELIYETKEIIDTIKQAESEIAKRKKENPDFKPSDARQYYENIYQELVEKYGKLRTTRKKSKGLEKKEPTRLPKNFNAKWINKTVKELERQDALREKQRKSIMEEMEKFAKQPGYPTTINT